MSRSIRVLGVEHLSSQGFVGFLPGGVDINSSKQSLKHIKTLSILESMQSMK